MSEYCKIIQFSKIIYVLVKYNGYYKGYTVIVCTYIADCL